MIGFAGLSHLGIVSSAAAAEKGFGVAGFDADAGVCRAVAAADPPIVEPGLCELLRDVKTRTTYSSDASVLAACAVIYISFDVPTDAGNRSDTGPVEGLLREAARVASPGTTLVVLSQVRPGFCGALRTEIESFGDKRLHLYYQVETLVFGSAVQRALQPERFIVGCADPSRPLTRALGDFLQAFGCPILPMRYESAELAKIAINHFLAASVAMTNTLAELCEAIGANWAEIEPALRLDRRIGPHAYLTPGLGIAGGNIERDLATVTTLAEQHGTDVGIVRAIVANSRHRRDWALRQVQQATAMRTDRQTVAVWGLAYKPGTASLKNSPSLALLDALTGADIRAYDPAAQLNGFQPHVTVVGSAIEACRDADVLVVMTPWDEFARIDVGQIRNAMRGRVVVDPFGALNAEQYVAQGFAYSRLGRPNE